MVKKVAENNIIFKYISYLKEVSRKIGIKTDFEKIYLKANKRNNSHTNQIQIEVYDYLNLLLFDELKTIFNLLDRNPDLRLFYGFGLICGRQGKYASPLIFAECKLDLKQDENEPYFKPGLNEERVYVNYELISSIIESKYFKSEDDEEIFNIVFEKEGRIVDKIESILSKSLKTEKELSKVSKEIFNILHDELDEFKDIITIDANNYDYKKEIESYLTSSKHKDSIFCSKNIYYVAANHIFVSRVPNQLSTFEALNTLSNEIKENKFKNETLMKLFMNAFSDKGFSGITFDYENENKVEQSIEEKIPVPLSITQKKALKNALLSELSYVQGPPGTGKSHTISALTLISVCLGKKILVVSQKPPAVEVVKEKVEEFLNVFPGIMSIVYFDKNFKKNLKDSINLILNIADNKYKLNEKVKSLELEIEKIDKKLNKKTSEINNTKEELEKNLSIQFEYTQINEKLLEFIKYFSNTYHKLNIDQDRDIIINPDLVQKIRNRLQEIEKMEKYSHDNRLNIIYRLNTLNSAFNKLYGAEYNNLLKALREKNITIYLDDLIKLNENYYALKDTEKRISENNEQLRKKYDYLLKERNELQKQFIKLIYEKKIYSSLLSKDNYENLGKFARMLGHKKATTINNYMKNINWKSVLDVFPIWISEIRNIGEILPMKPNMFDMVVVDEASQVNLAEILPVFYRGKNICIVGDHKQLSLISTGLTFQLNSKLDAFTWEKYRPGKMSYQDGITKNLVVTKSSILDFIRSEYNNFNIREVMLDEHFRSLPALAEFTNEKFYEGKLKVMTEVADKVLVNTFYPIRVSGKRSIEKIIVEEVNTVMDLLNFLIKGEKKEYLPQVKLNYFLNNDYSIGVISPIRNQVEAIKERIEIEFSSDIIDKYELKAGTPEELQGHERDIMIVSLCLDEDCFKSSNHYQNKNRLNVTTSRAKYFTFLVYSNIPDNFNLILSYVRHFNFEPNIAEVKFSEEIENPLSWCFNPQNFESEFERIVYHYLNMYVESKSNAHKLKIYNQVKACGYRLDFVIYNQSNRKSAVLEVDGKSHFNNNGKEYSEEHLDRIETLKRAGWKIVNTSYHHWYKNGWICDNNSPKFNKELNRIYLELDEILGLKSKIQ